jgi:hypothetical protein
MKILACILSSLLAAPVFAQTAASAPTDPWKRLAFLEGTWDANATGSGGAAVMGTYTFSLELRNHVLARHATSKTECKGPTDFDCEHADLLYIYQDSPGQTLKAIYFDNEGHVIHYEVSSPNARSALFLSDASEPGPQFRLTYELKDAILWGRFQMRPPGQTDWKTYLEWSGAKVK